MNFKKPLLCAIVAAVLLCKMIGCKCLHEMESVDYCQIAQTLQIGPYEFINESPVVIISRIFNDSNQVLAKHGYTYSIGITINLADTNFENRVYSISIRRNTIHGVLESIARELGCTLTCENGLFSFGLFSFIEGKQKPHVDGGYSQVGN